MYRKYFIFISVVIIAWISLAYGQQADQCSTSVGSNRSGILPYSGGGMHGFYNLGTKFLDALHQNSVPYNSIKSLIDYVSSNGPTDISHLWPKIRPIVKNQAGLITCLVLGILFIVVTPIVGCIFCCCRLCDNCGGKRVQNDPSTACFFVLLGLTIFFFIFMLTGAVLYAISSAKAYDNVEMAGNDVVQQGNDLIDFLVRTAAEVSCEVNTAFKRAMKDAADILTDLADSLITTLENESGITALTNLTNDLEELDGWWPKFNQSLLDFQSSVILLNSSFDKLYNDVKTKYPGHAPSVNDPEVIAELNSFYRAVSALQTNLSIIFDGNWPISADTIKHNISATQKAITQVGQELNNQAHLLLEGLTTANTTVSSALNQLDDLIMQVRNMIGNFSHDVVEYSEKQIHKFLDDYNWVHYVGLIVITPMLFAVLFIFIGVLFGLVGFRRKVHPSKRSTVSDLGGNFLMTAVGFLFIFGWIYMFATTVLFICGYSLQYVCSPVFYDPKMELYSFIGQWYTQNITIQSNNRLYNLELKDAIQGCQHDQTAYTALNLEQFIGPLLDQGSAQIQQALKDIPLSKFTDLITSQLVYQLPDSMNGSLSTIQSSLLAANQLMASPYVAFLSQKQANWTKQALEKYMDFLWSDHTLRQEAESVNKNLQYFYSNQSNAWNNAIVFMSWLNRSLADVRSATLPKKAQNQIVESINALANKFYTDVSRTTTAYVNDLKVPLETRVARCGPIYDTWQSLGTVICKELGYPLQGTWLGLGWCLVFFIPAIIVCVKLAKYFRKMDSIYPENYDELTMTATSFVYGDSVGKGGHRGRPSSENLIGNSQQSYYPKTGIMRTTYIPDDS